jgi:hypothetical protein
MRSTGREIGVNALRFGFGLESSGFSSLIRLKGREEGWSEAVTVTGQLVMRKRSGRERHHLEFSAMIDSEVTEHRRNRRSEDD